MVEVDLKDTDDICISFPGARWEGTLVSVFLRGVLKNPLPDIYRVKRGRGQRRSRRNKN
jgi:hypothetical protein